MIIRGNLGKVHKVDRNRNDDYLRDYLRVKVRLDVFHLLRRVLILHLPSDECVSVELLYEKLHAYCFL